MIVLNKFLFHLSFFSLQGFLKIKNVIENVIVNSS